MEAEARCAEIFVQLSIKPSLGPQCAVKAASDGISFTYQSRLTGCAGPNESFVLFLVPWPNFLIKDTF